MYKKWTIEEIKEVIDDISIKWNYPSNLPIEISTRAKRRMGAFFYKKVENKIIGIKFVFAKDLVDGNFKEELVREVIIHEYLHYYCDTKLGVSNGHNRVFKEACIRSNISSSATFQYKVRHGGDINDDRKKYFLYCKKCGKLVCVHKRKDAAENKMRKYISSCCGDRIIIK